MITGTVRSNEAWVRLTLIGPQKKRRTVAAIVDTGYTSFLSLDSAVIADLGLIWETSGRAILADGSECDYTSIPTMSNGTGSSAGYRSTRPTRNPSWG
jgi:predicted aspartyl protease